MNNFVTRAIEIWRKGIAPQLCDEALDVLAHAIRRNDPRLISGATCNTVSEFDWLGRERVIVVGACAAAYGLWRACDLDDERDLRAKFQALADECDQVLPPEPIDLISLSPFYFFTGAWDRVRDQVASLLLPEIEAELSRRDAAEDARELALAGEEVAHA